MTTTGKAMAEESNQRYKNPISKFLFAFDMGRGHAITRARATGGLPSSVFCLPSSGTRTRAPAQQLRTSVVLSGACLGHSVVIAAPQLVAPVGGQVLATRQIVGPRIAFDQSLGFPDYIELPVVLDFANENRLRKMMVIVHDRGSSGQIRPGDSKHGLFDLVDIGGGGFFDGSDPHIETDIMGFHRVVGRAFWVFDNSCHFSMNSAFSGVSILIK